MKDLPLISIIIPVYNAQNLLGKCLDSVLKQTYKNFELILVNDGSKDNSLNICKEWSLKDNRIITIDQENQGPGTARNNGFKAATGEYIYFLDADDFITDDLLTKTINQTAVFKYDMVIFGFNKITVEGKKISTIRHQEHSLENLQQSREILASLFLDGGCFAVWDKLFRRDFLIQNTIVFDKKKRGEDLAFMIQCFKHATSLKSIPDVLHNYHVVYNASHKYDKFIIENHTENFASLFALLSTNKTQNETNSNADLFLKRIFILWFGLVVPMNIVNNKELTLSAKKAHLKRMYLQKEFQEWLVYLANVKSSAKNELLFKVIKAKNWMVSIPVIKLLSFLRKKMNLTF